jgi:hypothetical protein
MRQCNGQLREMFLYADALASSFDQEGLSPQFTSWPQGIGPRTFEKFNIPLTLHIRLLLPLNTRGGRRPCIVLNRRKVCRHYVFN